MYFSNLINSLGTRPYRAIPASKTIGFGPLKWALGFFAVGLFAVRKKT